MNATINTNTKNAVDSILDYFNQHESVFNDAIEELDNYNGYLGDDRYYSMDELDDIFASQHATDILYRAFYGYDAETWHTDAHGEKEYGPFNPNRDYFCSNGYGNLVSADYKDYSDRIDEYAIMEMLEHRYQIHAINDNAELSALFDAIEEERGIA